MGLNVISCEGNNNAVYATKPGRSAYAANDFNGEMGVLTCAALLAIGGAAGAIFDYALKEYEIGNYAARIGGRFVESQDNKAPYGSDSPPYPGANFKTFGAKFAEVAEDAAFDPGSSPVSHDAVMEDVDLTATDLISELFKSVIMTKR